MSIKVALEHRTSYDFARPVTVGPHVVRLRPAPHSRTPIEAYSLRVEPEGHFLNWQQDPFGNWLARLVFPDKVERLEITVGLVADLMVINPFDFFVEDYAETYPFSYAPGLAADLVPYLRPVEGAEAADAFRRSVSTVPEQGAGQGQSQDFGGQSQSQDFGGQFQTQGFGGQFQSQGQTPAPGVPIIDFLADLNRAVHGRVAYSVRMEAGVQTPDLTLDRAIGSCRDSAWLMVALLRQYGLAARFVSGYLVQLAADQEALDGPSGPSADFTDLHAWAEVYLPGAGWVGMDPTSALFAGEGHIPLSATPHPSAAAPIEGLTEPVEVVFGFDNSVRRLHEDPRTTLPYTAEQWTRIDALGEAVDRRLTDGDVRLTMGGEPTFVALGTEEHAATDQWSTDADGPDKRAAADDLAERLRRIYAVGGVVHRGQGKWYPGEPLPRWTISLQWRTDGVPLWRDPDLLADPWAGLADAASTSPTDPANDPDADPAPEDTPPDPSAVAAQEEARTRAEALARRITRSLGLPADHLLPAYEDPLAALTSRMRQPGGERPEDGADKLDGHGLGVLDDTEDLPTGWVLPLAPAEDEGPEWSSPAWSFRRGRLVLLSGTSPVGLRLPLDSIAWRDPTFAGEPSYAEAGPALEPSVPAVRIVDPEGAPTTALTVEARDGLVHVFLPPTTRLEDYADVLRLVEVAARKLACPVVLEGYGPPPDPRLTQLSVTPDPGVIEVNVQPTRSWAEQRDLTTTLYEQARQARLATEKFEVDGLHTGTGGGNHLTLGGVEPADSPLLRRPDLLVSLITYWQRHPALSYLFSGRFIGPTSQAPRFDEGRPEATYEMEIAFAEVARLVAEQEAADEGLEPRPWLVDRALRHLLTDLTGNTHRAEFCIDKLYSPDSSRGRLGLLELRGFEMPPHPQMALVQALLVRALVAMFWERPLRAPLVRWGTRLHDDALLPHGARADIAEVVDDLRAAGLPFEQSFLDPFVEFRFPRIGVAEVEAATGGDRGRVEIELRQAIEPWNVLGEEATESGTARYVDSSVERLQVSVRGIDPHRHLLTCQGVPVPLTTAPDGSRYAGVRYRAWAPWSSLHPSIEPHVPLHFDVIDTLDSVSLGGATYHVVHPGGRSYDGPPVNANEAEARRAARFEARGHTPGRIDVGAVRDAGRRAASAEYPHTLDLRRAPRVTP